MIGRPPDGAAEAVPDPDPRLLRIRVGARPGSWWTSRTVSRILYRRRVTPTAAATIHLGTTLPPSSCGLPGCSDGQPSNAPCLTLLRVGFTKPHRSPGTLVVSYTTVSPSPAASRWRSVLCGTVPRVTPGRR